MDVVPNLNWANMPDKALITIFRNMDVSTLLSLVYTKKPGPNKHWLWFATSNEVWKERYKQLSYQPEVALLINQWVTRGFLSSLWQHELSDWAIRELYNSRQGNPRHQFTRPEVEPFGFYFVNFVLIWNIFPHVWRDDQGKWTKIQFRTLVTTRHDIPRPYDPQFYTDFFSNVRFEDRLIWIDSGKDKKVFPKILHSYVPKNEIAISYFGDITWSIFFQYRFEITMSYEEYEELTDRWVVNIVKVNKTTEPPVCFVFTTYNEVEAYLHVGDLYGKNISQIWIHDTNRETDLLQCSICTAPSKYVCGNCNQSMYCSRNCQKVDFEYNNHDVNCK